MLRSFLLTFLYLVALLSCRHGTSGNQQGGLTTRPPNAPSSSGSQSLRVAGSRCIAPAIQDCWWVSLCAARDPYSHLYVFTYTVCPTIVGESYSSILCHHSSLVCLVLPLLLSPRSPPPSLSSPLLFSVFSLLLSLPSPFLNPSAPFTFPFAGLAVQTNKPAAPAATPGLVHLASYGPQLRKAMGPTVSTADKHTCRTVITTCVPARASLYDLSRFLQKFPSLLSLLSDVHFLSLLL